VASITNELFIVLTAYDAATNVSRDVEAGMGTNDVIVTTSPPSESTAELDASAFSDEKVRLGFIRKVAART